MARRIESMTSTLACWLLALNCVGVLQVARCEPPKSTCEAGLFEVLNNKDLKIKAVEQTLDSVEDKTRTMIGQVSVAQIWKFKSESCDLADLVDLDILSREVSYSCPKGDEPSDGLRVNYGVRLFLDTYRPKRTKACREAILPKFKEDVSNIPYFDGEKIDNFYCAWNRALLSKEEFPKVAAWGNKHPQLGLKIEQGHHSQTCYRLTERLGKYMPYRELIRSHLNVKSIWKFYRPDETVDKWTNIMNACETYLDRYCKLIESLGLYIVKPYYEYHSDASANTKKSPVLRHECADFKEEKLKWNRLIAHPSNN